MAQENWSHFNIGLSESQYNHDRAYWEELADKRAVFENRAVKIIINGEARYTA